MAIRYRVDVLKWLKAAGYNTTRIRREALLGQSTLTKLRRGELLSWGETGRVCEMLHCQPGDLFVYFPETAEGAKVPGPSEYQRGVDVIAAAVGASGETITACATRAHMSAITIAEAVNMTDSQLVVIGDYLLGFADGAETRGHKAETRAAGDGAEAEAVTVEPAEAEAQAEVDEDLDEMYHVVWGVCLCRVDRGKNAYAYVHDNPEYARSILPDFKKAKKTPYKNRRRDKALDAFVDGIIAHMEAERRAETGSEAGAGDLSPGDGGTV